MTIKIGEKGADCPLCAYPLREGNVRYSAEERRYYCRDCFNALYFTCTVCKCTTHYNVGIGGDRKQTVCDGCASGGKQ